MRIVYEGRGGYVEVAGVQYPIEHVGEGRFAIHVRGCAAHLLELEALVASDPARWALERHAVR